MADREKVMRGLECCLLRSQEKVHCGDCPYWYDNFESGCHVYDMMRDALALLKEQEARVMTLAELQAIETPWNRSTPPYLFVEGRSPTGSRWMSWGFMHDFVRLRGTIGVQNYGSKWRVWNLQPTPEQMRDTKWEEEA